jgi:hypothetical protein
MPLILSSGKSPAKRPTLSFFGQLNSPQKCTDRPQCTTIPTPLNLKCSLLVIRSSITLMSEFVLEKINFHLCSKTRKGPVEARKRIQSEFFL